MERIGSGARLMIQEMRQLDRQPIQSSLNSTSLW
jgi:hypothetical protein